MVINTYLSPNAHICLQENDCLYSTGISYPTYLWYKNMLIYYKKIKNQVDLLHSLTLMFLGTAAVFAPKLVDLIVVAVSVKTVPLLDFLIMTVFFDLILVLKE